MPFLTAVDPATATGESKALFDPIERRLTRVPNMIRVMANSPAILETYLHFNAAFEHTKLSPKLRGLITVAVSEINGCDYTLSTAMALGRREGLSDDQLEAARRAEADDAKAASVLRFAARVIRQRGHVLPAELDALRLAGFGDEEIVEIIAAVALNLFHNYFNLIVKTDVDFPLVRTGHPAALDTTA